jgi:hypothetical protein
VVLLVWPSPWEAKRFLWVVLPVLLAQPLLLAAALRRPRLREGTAALLAALALAMALPAVAFAGERYREAAYTDLPPEARDMSLWYRPDPASAREAVESQLAMIGAMRLLAQAVPAGDCVIAIRPEWINYFGHRRSMPPPLNSVPDPGFTTMILQSGCHYAFGLGSNDVIFPALHPLQRLGAHARTVYVSRLGGPQGDAYVMAALVRLDN